MMLRSGRPRPGMRIHLKMLMKGNSLNVTMIVVLLVGLAALGAGGVRAAENSDNESDEPWLQPYRGPTRTDVDATTLDGKVLCGYQGWFNTPGDGAESGFRHWGSNLGEPDRARFVVDMWPDVS